MSVQARDHDDHEDAVPDEEEQASYRRSKCLSLFVCFVYFVVDHPQFKVTVGSCRGEMRQFAKGLPGFVEPTLGPELPRGSAARQHHPV